MTRRLRIALVATLGVLAPLAIGATSTVCSGAGCVCNADLNGDGASDAQNEQATCQSYAAGPLCPLQQQACVVQAGAPTCPADPDAPCIDTGGGHLMCSASQCFLKGTTVTSQADAAQPPPADNGPRDSNNNCLGTLKVFAGQGARCREEGTQTVWQNCCHNKLARLNDTMGAAGGPSQTQYKQEASTIEFWDNQCDQQDQQTALLADSGYCIYVDDYCAEEWITGCVQRAKSYCCFNSLLGRMIQEQGRAQLPAMGSFGSGSTPACDGFTMAQFQSLDFSKIDLSAYYTTLQTQSQSVMQQKAQDNATQNYSQH